eukprot:471225-Rhodomonas_salina.1
MNSTRVCESQAGLPIQDPDHTRCSNARAAERCWSQRLTWKDKERAIPDQIEKARECLGGQCGSIREAGGIASRAAACGAVRPPRSLGKEKRQRAVPGDNLKCQARFMIITHVAVNRRHCRMLHGATATE